MSQPRSGFLKPRDDDAGGFTSTSLYLSSYTLPQQIYEPQTNSAVLVWIKIISFSSHGTDDIFTEDRPDINQVSQTSFVYNPNQNSGLREQRARLPITACKNNLLYLLETHQVDKEKPRPPAHLHNAEFF